MDYDKKNFERGLSDMAEEFNYLSDSEKELLARRREFTLADTIESVGVLAVQLESMSVLAERIRGTDPALVKKLGKKAQQTTTLLEQLGIAPTVVTEPLVLESGAVENEPVANEGVSAEGMAWLIKYLTPDWHLRLGIDHDASAITIADALLAVAPSRRRTSIELNRTRIIGKLAGKSDQEIALLNEGDTTAAVYQYVRLLLRGLNQNNDQVSEVQTSIQPFVDGTVETPAVFELEESVELDEVEITKPPHVYLGDMISEKLTLTGAQRMALRSFLDPKTKNDMTSIKQDVVKQVREVIRKKIDDPEYQLTQEEKLWLRKSFAVYAFRGTPQDRDPIPLNELTNSNQGVNQKNEASGFIYDGLHKLFSENINTIRYIDDFVQAAVTLESMPNELFEDKRNELFLNFSKKGIVTDEQVTALRKRAQYGKMNHYMESSQSLKDALRIIERQVVASGGVNSGNALIDTTLKRFVGPTLVTSHLDALRSELPLELQADPRYIERIITAGLHSVYRQIGEEA